MIGAMWRSPWSRPRATGPQIKQARPSVKAARIDEPERAWRLRPIARAGACRSLRRSGSVGHGMETWRQCSMGAFSPAPGCRCILAGRSSPDQYGGASSCAQPVIGCCANPYCCRNSPGRHCGGQLRPGPCDPTAAGVRAVRWNRWRNVQTLGLSAVLASICGDMDSTPLRAR